MPGLSVHTDKIITILYEKAINYLTQAIRELDADNLPAASNYVKNAQDIIIELNSALDLASGSNVAKNLNRIYNFLSRHLTKANTEHNPQMLREAVALLEEINHSWKTIAGE
ncbi:MAG TPA: flagellar export chaperone FliS [Anaerohalosphaeraceae bacterium]|nr:flagellar export chaperone FliS [Anaerohalosphaeraceae bacterium]HRT50087.1 flagellar export chaperone FliS [Anaerohalosphaeraceae bacterium]HRT86021.1 flagellar export chaperone FliS [Anaerohalosphaeraceae bacterium]